MSDGAARRRGRARTPVTAAALGVLFFACFNANGREIAASDSLAAKFSSVMLARRGALTLDGVVGRQPLYGDRVAFSRDRAGRWRNSYPMPPVFEGAAVASAMRGLGLLALDAPLAPQIVAKVTASLFSSLAGLLAFAAARRVCSAGQAAIVAIGFALGTGIWPTASQTLWQHATAIWSLMAAIALWTGGRWRSGLLRCAMAGALLGWSLAARPQTLPLVGIVAAGMLVDSPPRQRAALAVALLAPALLFAGLNVMWFGHPAGAIAQYERLNMSLHGTVTTWQSPLAGVAGLLASPSRGLLVFSPIVLVTLFARPLPSERAVVWWTLSAAAAQLLLYGSYAVWWGGYTYGPRYLLDALPALVPAAASGVSRLASRGRAVRAVAAAALAWSVAVSATGAFCHPHDEWNSDPVNVDRAHERLWEVRDSQILRCWSRGPSPYNFVLFDRALWKK
jgi:hypothetical protein